MNKDAKDITTISISAFPCLAKARPANTPMTAKKMLIFLFTITYSPPFRLPKELFRPLLKIALNKPINKVYSTLYLMRRFQ